MTAFDPDRIHTTYNIEAAFGGTIPVVEHCHHCVGGNCTGSCIIHRSGRSAGCVHSGLTAVNPNTYA